MLRSRHKCSFLARFYVISAVWLWNKRIYSYLRPVSVILYRSPVHSCLFVVFDKQTHLTRATKLCFSLPFLYISYLFHLRSNS